jgi:hypothetical protein
MGKVVVGYTGEPREYPPAKMYFGACIGVYEIGHHGYKPGPNSEEKVTLKYILDFELWRNLRGGPAAALDSKGRQFTVPMFVGAYLGSPDAPQPANCLLACEALLARTFRPADLEAGVDLETLLRRTCKLNLKPTGGPDSAKVKIADIIRMDDDDPTFRPNGPFHYWSIPMQGTWEIPDPSVMPCETARIFLRKSREWLAMHPGDAGGGGGTQADRDKAASENGATRGAGQPTRSPAPAAGLSEDEDMDIPF